MKRESNDQPTVELDDAGQPVAARELPVVPAGLYELLGEVARGGAGRILRARDRRLQREVALKQLHDRSNRARFVREALVTARLQHPAIIPVHEVGQFPSGEPFIAMKLVRGQSLREVLAARPTLAERLELLPNVLAVADAMAYAHSMRVIHRDLKPSNVLVGAFGETVVIDWGLAKQLDEHDLGPSGGEPAAATVRAGTDQRRANEDAERSATIGPSGGEPAAGTVPAGTDARQANGGAERSQTITARPPAVSPPPGQLDSATASGRQTPPGNDATLSGQVLGTPAYMPPEQAGGSPADERSDVYALGALLYQVVAGAPPFEGRDAATVLRDVLTRRPTPLGQRQPDAPAELLAIVDRAMARHPEERYADARALADDLRRFHLGQWTSLARGRVAEDATLAAELQDEQRRRTLRALRVTCILGLVLIPLFAFVDLIPLHVWFNERVAARALLLAVVGAILAATYRPFGERWSHELAMLMLGLIGVFIIGLGWMRHGAPDPLFTPSMMMVFLACSALFQMPAIKMVVVLGSLTVAQLVVALGWEKPAPFDLSSQMAFLGSSLIVVVIGGGITERLQRSEFYGRRRLERANQRLAQLGQRGG